MSHARTPQLSPGASVVPASPLKTSEDGAWVTAGYIVRAHGVHGAMRAVLNDNVVSHGASGAGGQTTGDAQAWYAALKYVRLTGAQGQPQVCTLLTCRPIHGAMLFTCAEIVGREAAMLWAGASLQVPKHCVPTPPEGEAYVYELVGAGVVDTSGQPLGTVRDIVDNAGQPLLVITSPEGEERLLPLVAQTLSRVDRAARQLVVRVPFGLWDED